MCSQVASASSHAGNGVIGGPEGRLVIVRIREAQAPPSPRLRTESILSATKVMHGGGRAQTKAWEREIDGTVWGRREGGKKQTNKKG